MANEFLQEIKITELNTPPAIGSTQEPNVIWIVPISDKVCDIYTSDNNGLVRATSVQTPVFESIDEANATIPITNRFDCKEVLIKKTYSQEITNADGETQTITGETYTLYWWKGGTEDKDLKLKSFGLEAVLSNGNRLPAGQVLKFTNSEDLIIPDKYTQKLEGYTSMNFGAGKDGTSFFFTTFSEKQLAEGSIFYRNNIVGSKVVPKIKKGFWGTQIIGGGAYENAEEAISNSIVIGHEAMTNFTGLNPTKDSYTDYGNPWGKSSYNIAIGQNAGSEIINGGRNVFIGPGTKWSFHGEYWDTLGIDNSIGLFTKYKESGNPDKGTDFCYIVGNMKHGKRYFELNTPLRLRPYYTPKVQTADLTDIESLLYRSIDKGTVKAIDKAQLIKAVLLSDEINFTEEEQNILKTKIGIA